ncbi:hypothetical protein BDZ91DRAFT_735992 [Kalaharituber pfeilii]|nr:hypothetical protein BDZ91DRAFT_735992 [Kalaharituber pfeilii]
MPPQALSTTYPTRLNTFNTGLITPIIAPPSLSLAVGTPGTTRTTKRGTQIINYAEVEDDDDIYEDRPERGSVSLQNNPSSSGAAQQQPSALSQALGYDLSADGIQKPVYILPGKEPRRPIVPPSFLNRSEAQLHEASLLPEHLVPIKLDMDIDSSRRLKDTFLWNINETLITPDHFAMTMCMDLDLPPHPFSAQIAAAIRTQVEEYAAVATMPLPPGAEFRTIINLEICLRKFLYMDKFEWDVASISPPPPASDSPDANTPALTPESFARATCADLGLTGEFIPAIASAIYEAALSHKKGILESGGVPAAPPENDAAYSAEAGWRIDQENLGAGWAPRMLTLTKEDLEKREGDRERQIRRLRRETNRFGANSVGLGLGGGSVFGDLGDFETPGREGRGERKKRKRNRSLSPPAGRGTPMANGGSSMGTAGPGSMAEWERANWRCTWCSVPGTSTWAIRDGPFGPKSLCHACGLIYHSQATLPEWMKGLHWVKGGGANAPPVAGA